MCCKHWGYATVCRCWGSAMCFRLTRRHAGQQSVWRGCGASGAATRCTPAVPPRCRQHAPSACWSPSCCPQVLVSYSQAHMTKTPHEVTHIMIQMPTWKQKSVWIYLLMMQKVKWTMRPKICVRKYTKIYQDCYEWSHQLQIEVNVGKCQAMKFGKS